MGNCCRLCTLHGARVVKGKAVAVAMVGTPLALALGVLSRDKDLYRLPIKLIS